MLAFFFTFGKYQRTTVKQDKSSTPTLALDIGSCFVPAALWYQLSRGCSGTALPGEFTAQVWAQLPPPLCGAGLCHLGIPMEGVCKRQPRKDNPLVIRLECPQQVPSATPRKKLEQFKMVKPWGASGQQKVPGRRSQVWHQCPLCQSLLSPAVHLRHCMNFLTVSSPASGQPAWSCSQEGLPRCGQV